MKNTLTNKHLAPYLPYGLKVQYHELDDNGMEEGGVTKLSGLYYEDDIATFLDCMDYYFDDENDVTIKPILRPLSDIGDSDDLRKVHEFIGLGKWCEQYDFYFACWFNDLANIDKLVLQAPYEISQYFFANHYDFFSLIPKGLAIDINTLK